MADFSSALNIGTNSLETTSTAFQNIPVHKYDILEKWIVILLESDVREHQVTSENLIKQYCDIVSDVKIFNCANRCVDFMTDLLDEKVCLILWKPIGNTLLPLIHDANQLKFVYGIHDIKNDDTSLKMKWKKFQGSFSCMVDIFYHFKENIRKSEYDLISISTISPSTADNINELDPSFMYSQLLKDILLKMQYNKSSKTDFANRLRAEYANNSIDLKSVNTFDQTYSDKSPIWWYTKEVFIYGPLNRALRTQETEIIICMGFYIQDLHREIERLYKEQQPRDEICVYRGQAMGKNDFEKLQNNQGGLLSFNNFLSTSIDKEVSLLLAESSAGQPNSVGILFQIKINPLISTIPFASVEQFSNFSTEKEFLFSMHTICRIDEIKNIQPGLWEVNLTLTDENDEQLKQITESIRRQIENGSASVSLGYLLLRMGKYDTAKKIYEKSLTSTPDDDVRSRLFLYNILGGIEYSKSVYSTALSYFQKMLDLCPLPDDFNINMTDIYSNMAMVHHAMGNYSRANDFYELIAELREKSDTSSPLDLGLMYNNIAVNHTAMEHYDVALNYFQKSLNILQVSLPPAHPDLCVTYINIGMINSKLGEREVALRYFEKVLEIQRKSLPPTHEIIAGTLSNLASEYHWIGQYKTAIQYFEEALTIMQTSSLCEHTDFGAIQNNIGQLYKTCGEYEKALPYFLNAIKIQKAISPLGDLKLVVYYVNIAMLYNYLGDFSTAIHYLEIAEKDHQTSVLGSQHVELLRIYNGFGMVYHEKKDFWNALYYFEKAMKIQETTFSSTHPDLACIYNNIAGIELKLGHEENALKHIQKVLDILKKHLSHNHPEIGRTYFNMGTIYLRMNNYEKTQDCFTETYNIYKVSLPIKHPYFGKFYANLGLLNCMMRNFPKALKHLEKAREIFQEILPSNHPDLAEVNENISKVQQQMSSFGPIWRNF